MFSLLVVKPIFECGAPARSFFREVMEHKACRIIQADPIVMGGFTECLNIVGMAAIYGVKLCFHDVNIQLQK